MQVESYLSCIPQPVVCEAYEVSPSDDELEFLVHQVRQLPQDDLEEMMCIVSAYEPQWLDVLGHTADAAVDVKSLSPLAIEVMQHYVYTDLACCFVASMDSDNETDDEAMDVDETC
ncbi:hypothetical protein DYB32_000042 [Aphanomyces invadans]|uniref:NET domain-containing protein n=1 Tax=Aphanomyces invadans TaxID=157072 RepID=A0A3R6YHH0_9STRA|nr:hypothetical protein DYB32_000042 [Aphanomyces invadans]